MKIKTLVLIFISCFTFVTSIMGQDINGGTWVIDTLKIVDDQGDTNILYARNSAGSRMDLSLQETTYNLDGTTSYIDYYGDAGTGSWSLTDGMISIGNKPPVPIVNHNENMFEIAHSIELPDSTGGVISATVFTRSIRVISSPTDFNFDGVTDGLDFSIFLGNYQLNCNGCPTDLNSDGTTDGLDFSILIGNFGQ